MQDDINNLEKICDSLVGEDKFKEKVRLPASILKEW